MNDLQVIEQDGREAYSRGQSARDCPYSFINSPFWQRKDYDAFSREYRPKLDAWMRGWIAAKKASL